MKIKTEDTVVKSEPYIKMDKNQRDRALKEIKKREEEENERKNREFKQGEQAFKDYFVNTVIETIEPLIADKYNTGYIGEIEIPFDSFKQDDKHFSYDNYQKEFEKWFDNKTGAYSYASRHYEVILRNKVNARISKACYSNNVWSDIDKCIKKVVIDLRK